MISSFLFSVLLLIQSIAEISPILDYKVPKADTEFCEKATTGHLAVPPGSPSLTPRVFPLCVGKRPGGTDWPDQVVAHTNIYNTLKVVEEILHFSPNQQTMERNGGRLRVYAIKGQNGGELARKLFLEFDFSRLLGNHDIDAIYLQALYGPYGFPFGTFHFDNLIFQGNPPPGSRQYIFPSLSDQGFVVPCTYKVDDVNDGSEPPTVPHVVVWERTSPGANPVKQTFGVIFEWNEPQACTQAAFFQFIVIIVTRDDNNISVLHAMLSNIILPPADWYRRDLIPVTGYTYQPGRNTIGRDLDAVTARFVRITPNFDFEMCMRYGINWKIKQGLYSCGRGSQDRYFCTQGAPWTGTDRGNEYSKWIDAYNRYSSRRGICQPPAVPTTSTSTTSTTTTTTTTTTTPTATTTTTASMITVPTTTTLGTTTPQPLLHELEEKLTTLAKQVEKKKKITHGDLCIFAWFVLFPPSNYMARYFKDSSKTAACTLGYWIILHVFAHHIGILLIWISFGLIMASGEDFFGGVNAIHLIFGIVSTVSQMILIFHSMWPRKEKQFTLKDAPVQHVSYGYIAWGMTVFCIFKSNEITLQKQGMVGALVAVTIVANLVGTWIEKRIDKYLAIFPPRRYFPEMERITIDGRTPYTVIKRLWFGIYVVVLFGLYLWLALHQSLFANG